MGWTGTPEEVKEKQKAYSRAWYKKNKDRVIAYNRDWVRKNPEKKKAQLRRYIAKNPDRVRKLFTDKHKRWRAKNLEKYLEYGRQYQKRRAEADPNYRRTRKLWANFRLTPEQWDALFEAQGRRCAICHSTDPGSKYGWNTDHCHKTGKVRFILCAHCNRGLGAFKDSPELMRRAADALEALANTT